MRISTFYLILALTAALHAEDHPNDDKTWTRDGLNLATSRFEQTTLIPHPADKSLTAFIHESERD